MKIKNKKIVITGGNGRFARVLKNTLTNEYIYFPDKKKLNITNLKSIEKYLKIIKPKILKGKNRLTKIIELSSKTKKCSKKNSLLYL